MIKVLLAVLALIVAALIGGVYFSFNPAIPIFVILGVGIFLVGRIGGPQLPPGTHVSAGPAPAYICAARISCRPTRTITAAETCVTALIPMISAMRADLTAAGRAEHRPLLCFVAQLIPGMAAIGCAVVSAQDAPKVVSPDAYPAGVQQALQHATADCKAEGGSGVTFAPDSVRAFDLGGDGRDDHIISYHDAECHDYSTAYCGSGGCRLDILVTLPSGSQRTVFGEQVRDYEILPGTGAHHPVRIARRLLRRPWRAVVLQDASHHGAAVQVHNAAVGRTASAKSGHARAGDACYAIP